MIHPIAALALVLGRGAATSRGAAPAEAVPDAVSRAERLAS